MGLGADGSRLHEDDTPNFLDDETTESPRLNPSELAYLPSYNEWEGRAQHKSSADFNVSNDWSLTPPDASSSLREKHTDAARSSPRKSEYQCLYPGCRQKPFGRTADLERHIMRIHFPESQRYEFNCDYRRCARANIRQGFTRRDHFRHHLRDFHKEDLLLKSQRGADVGGWLRKRPVDLRWWRCWKCLLRIKLEENGWECPECRQVCERERQVARNEKAKTGEQEASALSTKHTAGLRIGDSGGATCTSTTSQPQTNDWSVLPGDSTTIGDSTTRKDEASPGGR